MAEFVRGKDWTQTPLGAIESWSQALVASVNIILSAGVPMQLLVGPEMIEIYNDALLPFLSSKHPQALGQPARVVWREVWPAVEKQLHEVLHTGAPVNFTNVFLPLLRNGVLEDMYWDYSYSPFYEADGTILGVLNLAQNKTEAVLAQQRLRASEAQAQRVLNSIGDAVIVTDADGHIRSMNPVAEALTEWPLREARGRPLEDVFSIISEATRLSRENPVSKAKRLGTSVGLANHTILLSRDGRETHIDDSAAPIRKEDGSVAGVVLVFRDITERRAAEQLRERLQAQVQESYAELEAIYDGMTIALGMVDPVTYHFLRVNAKLAEILDIPAEQVVGTSVLAYAADAQKVAADLERAGAGEPVIGSIVEGEIPGSPGIKRFFQVDFAPVRGAQGQVSSIIVASVEITLLKQAERALVQNEKLAAVGRLASSIAHEINNPLESVTNLLYLAQSSEELSEAQRYLETAERELRRVSAIANQTLRFHRQATDRRFVTCKELLESVLAIHQGRIVNSGVSVELRKRSETPILCFDGEIRQVLNNLVGNAIDAMHPTGGRLVVRSRERTIWSSGTRALMITIADTGDGMSLDTRQRLFEPFFTTKGFGGTGLGLWISKEIIERHQGTLAVSSSQRPGHTGTVFTVTLPYATTTDAS